MNLEHIDNVKDAMKYFREHIDYSREHLVLIGLDARNKVLLKKVLFIGGLTSFTLDFRVLFKELLLHSCNSFILGHNRPLGDLSPSQEDIEVYNKLLRSS